MDEIIRYVVINTVQIMIVILVITSFMDILEGMIKIARGIPDSKNWIINKIKKR